jgi:hypothetical protein
MSAIPCLLCAAGITGGKSLVDAEYMFCYGVQLKQKKSADHGFPFFGKPQPRDSTHGATWARSQHVAQSKTLVEEGIFVKQKKVFKQIKDSYLWDSLVHRSYKTKVH